MAEESTALLKDTKKTLYFLTDRKAKSAESENDLFAYDQPQEEKQLAENNSIWTSLRSYFGAKRSFPTPSTDAVPKPRKLPVKVEPKVFFANERTFLAWLHMSVTLASISVAIVAFAEANEWSQLYGLLLMPVAISFCVYSLYMYTSRAAMIRRKDPGPYEDRVGPIVLSSMLALAILVNFFVKLYDISNKS
eukprot:gene25650-34223_t